MNGSNWIGICREKTELVKKIKIELDLSKFVGLTNQISEKNMN